MAVTSRSGTSQDVNVTMLARTPSSIKSILLSGNWLPVQDAELVQFAIGEAHSPITPSRLYPALRYRSNSRVVTTPLSFIEGYEFSERES